VKTLVVGGSGFLGGAIVSRALAQGDDVTIFDIRGSQAECDERFGDHAVRFVRGDVLDRAALSRALHDVDEVFHFAGKLGTSELDETPSAAVEVNILGSINVFELAIEREVPRVFHASKPNVWLNVYTITKHAAEQLADMYAADAARTRIRSLRYFNAYGPWQSRAPIRKIMPTFVDQALARRPLEIYGDGEQVVDLIYSDDLARLTIEYLRAGEAPASAPDCGRGVPITVNQVALAVNDLVGNPAGVRHLPMRRGEVAGTTLVAQTDQLLEAVQGFTFSDWRASLQETVDWYASHACAQPAHR
jgi:UDP-glucose 4-epimerase